MTPEERVLCALRRAEPDRVPLFYRDVPEVEERLRRELGLSDREELLRLFDIDFRWVEPRYIGPPLEDQETGIRRDVWGAQFRYVEASAGGNWEPCEFPLADVTDPAALADHPWPRLEWFDFDALDAQIESYAGYAIMTAPGVASPGVWLPALYLRGIEQTMMDMFLNPELLDILVLSLTKIFDCFIKTLN